MKNLRHPAVVTTIIIAAICLAVGFFVTADSRYEIGGGHSLRLVRDTQETQHVYYDRSAYLADGELPYQTDPQEYPVLGLLYLSWPRIVTDEVVVFEQLFAGTSAFILIIVVALTTYLLKALGKNPWRVALLLLPASLYFTFNRFDIVPVGIVLASLVLTHRRRFGWAIALLAVGFFIKWYTVLLIPIILLYADSQMVREQYDRWRWRMLALATGVILIPSAILLGLTGYLSVFPYAYHMSRGVEYGTVLVPYLAQVFRILSESGEGILMRMVSFILFSGQIGLPLILFLNGRALRRRVTTMHDVIRWMSCIIILFLLLAKFYSPQFFLWIAPLLIITARDRKDIWLIVAMDLIHYLTFPVIFDVLGWASSPYAALALVRSLLYGIILYRLLPEIGAFVQAAFRRPVGKSISP